MKKPHKSGCNEVCKAQKDLQSDCLLSTIFSVAQISSDTAQNASTEKLQVLCIEIPLSRGMGLCKCS